MGRSAEEAAVGFSDVKTGSGGAASTGADASIVASVVAGAASLAAGESSPGEEEFEEEEAAGVAGGLGPASLELLSSRRGRALTGGRAAIARGC